MDFLLSIQQKSVPKKEELNNCRFHFFLLYNWMPICAGLSHKTTIKYIYVCGRVCVCGKIQGVLIILDTAALQYTTLHYNALCCIGQHIS